jgi:hypothetical protein
MRGGFPALNPNQRRSGFWKVPDLWPTSLAGYFQKGRVSSSSRHRSRTPAQPIAARA